MHESDAFADVTLLFERELKTPLDLAEHRLIPGYQGELGLPVEAFLRLYVVRDDRIVGMIDAPRDLTPFVAKVESAEQALAFVQLFTALETHYLFERDKTIVDLSIVPDTQATGIGAITKSRAQGLGIEAPQVKRDDHGFLIERNLVESTTLSGPRNILRRVESFSGTGHYALVAERTLARLSADEVQVPYYE